MRKEGKAESVEILRHKESNVELPWRVQKHSLFTVSFLRYTESFWEGDCLSAIIPSDLFGPTKRGVIGQCSSLDLPLMTNHSFVDLWGGEVPHGLWVCERFGEERDTEKLYFRVGMHQSRAAGCCLGLPMLLSRPVGHNFHTDLVAVLGCFKHIFLPGFSDGGFSHYSFAPTCS